MCIVSSMSTSEIFILDRLQEELGSNAFSKTSDFRLSEWLATQEDKHRITLYECDPTLNHWTKLCIRHADVIFILADPKGIDNTSPCK